MHIAKPRLCWWDFSPCCTALWCYLTLGMVFNPRIQPETLTPIFCTKINTIPGRLSKWFWGYKMLKPNSYATFRGIFFRIFGGEQWLHCSKCWPETVTMLSFKSKDSKAPILSGRHWGQTNRAPMAAENLSDTSDQGSKVWHLVGTGGACWWHQKWHRTAL